MGPEKNPLFGDNLAADMAKLDASRRRLAAARSPADRLAFVDSFNRLLGHPRRKFTPIKGDNFKL